MTTEPVSDGLALAAGRPLLHGQTVILTGAGGGIGRWIAELAAAAGARLVLIDIVAESLEPVVERARALGSEVEQATLDLLEPGAFAALHTRIEREIGPVDGLVNCAGLWQPESYDRIAMADYDAAIAVNLTSSFVTCQVCLPAMVERRSGSVVNFASTAGEYGSISPAAHYAAAKAGVIGMTKSLAREVGPYEVRVNALSPGPTDTVALGAATPEQKAAAGARTLFDRLGRPEEIAAATVFLLSPLSTFITGHVLGVNGGSLL